MNNLRGKITEIQKSGSISLIDVEVDRHLFSAILISSQDEYDWLKIGNLVSIIFNETEVSLAKELSGRISLRNRIPCIVKSVNKGAILSKIELKFKDYIITSIITTRSVISLGIAIGDEVEALIKANEVTLMEKI